MNVLLLADLIVNSGVGKYIVELSDSLSKQGNVVLVSPLIDRQDIIESDNLHVIKTESITLRNIFSDLKIIDRVIKDYHIDVVHCNHRKQMFLMRLYKFLYGRIPVVWTCHTVPYPNNLLKRLLGYYGDRTIAISSEAFKWMQKELKISEKRIDLILNGVNDSTLQPSKEDKNDKKKLFFNKYSINIEDNSVLPKVIVLHGRIDHVKGLDTFVNAFSEIDLSLRKNVVVVFSGDTSVPYYSELSQLIREKKVDDICRFVGWVETNEILGVADLMVAPSRREGFLLSAIEAFLMKVPLIRTKTGGYCDMANCCVGLNVDDTDSFKNEIEKWLISPELYAEMVEKAYSFAKDNCTIEKMANKTIETYKKAINVCQAS